ncbi:Na(+)/H(+) exchange regulatory cofactor NHE-RF2 [Ctenopharyngodon idella]|uniref:Na(+)/H(+) exchange regulatory cofactor NHE-RF2 n=1 Tax=Ctenopharyngodon idella TaxID=7959 RepID=UPI002232735D|nr:Na(+)/H(+) exchange regulatory cofactor NHE-RF2 [Ctenopharyngodon idella]XP_051765605.1 Na(+)/H(+) exchange regulatory cofactor NHE-RF2 [Ctenopharyngodon idella]
MANTLEREILERELRPRLCYLTKGDRGYGFHLHGERNRGAQYIRKIEPGSPADLSGLRSGDRVVEVNGENVEGETHHQVVQRILEVEHRTRLLVVDRVTEEFLKFHGLPCTEDRAIEMGSLSARSSAASSPRASPRHPATPPYSRQSSEGIFINKSPSSTGGVMNGSPLYRAHARLASPVLRSPTSPCEPKTELEPEPFTELFTELTIESSVTPEIEPVCDLSTDLSTAQTNTQEEASSEADVVTKDLRPRLCHMTLGEQGYGFNLHCKKSRVGQFIRSVDPDSPAEHAGLRPKDRLIEVNDTSIEGLRHAEVVELIRAGGRETRLLVVDPETDELFNRLGIVPTSTHLKEDCVDGPIIEGPETTCPTTDSPVSASPVPEAPRISPPIINITLTDPPITNGSPRHQSQRSSSSRSTLSETSAELSSFDTSNRLTDSDHQSSDDARKPNQDVKSEERRLDPFWESGLDLSLTAAEAKQKARAKRANKRAPPMDWSKKQQIFSNF